MDRYNNQNKYYFMNTIVYVYHYCKDNNIKFTDEWKLIKK